MNKTKATEASVEAHIAAIANAEQRKDCESLVILLRRITKQEPKMWGPTIVGFGMYHYQYESGREGDSCLTGFAARGKEVVVYLTASSPEQQALLARLGKHRMGKACLYFRRLSEIDISILEKLVKNSLAEIKRRYR
ncbi:DUF1801 domain-containing protein [candidate division KSB1 bacterium]|nr:DUF1801 domain-containing protein [bacterium]NUM66478.1 DUF1801 domain-containing protein [candidate division KSB1 bacterium]